MLDIELSLCIRNFSIYASLRVSLIMPPKTQKKTFKNRNPAEANLGAIYYQSNIYRTANPAAPNATPQNAAPRATRDAAPVNCGTPVAEVTVPLLNAPVPEGLSGTVVLRAPGAELVSVSRPPEDGAAE